MPCATRTIAAVHGEKELNAYALKQHVPDPELWKFLKHSVLERRRQVDEVRPRRAAQVACHSLSLNQETMEPMAEPIRLHINGAVHSLRIEPRVSLLDALREYLGLTGAKKGCNQGACGACTVLVDGKRVFSCLTLVVQCEDREVLTIEGLSGDGARHPIQEAFIHQDAFQCGYCTP